MQARVTRNTQPSELSRSMQLDTGARPQQQALQTGKHKEPSNLPPQSLHHPMRSSGPQAELMRQTSPRGTEQ